MSASDVSTDAPVPIVCPPGPPSSANDVLRPTQHDGQTFVSWPDSAQGEAGAATRYDVYRALSPITQDNLANARRVAHGVLNDSGRLFGTAFTSEDRLDPDGGMTVIAQDAEPLPPWTGLFVHTATEEACAYYAVVPTDAEGNALETIVPGRNATTAPVTEHVQPRKAIKLYDSASRGVDSPSTKVTGTPGLPLMLLLHASNAQGGGAGGYGDYYLYYADQTMGYVDGLPGVFSVEETHSGEQMLLWRNRDVIVHPTAGYGFETYWFGYHAVPDWADAGSPPLAYPFTERRLSWMLGEILPRYSADPNRVYCEGGSMGAWGSTSYCFHHPELFAAVYPDRPRTRQRELPSFVAPNPAATAVTDDGTPFLERMDSVKFAAEHHEDLPFYAWVIGRNDGFASWKEQVDMVHALAASHHGFAFLWNDGDHGGTSDIAGQMQAMYPPSMFAKDASYPAFANSSIDDVLGTADPANGALSGGINLGFTWTSVRDELGQWSAAISNTRATATMTVDVTPRRCQRFRPTPNQTIHWTTSTGGAGTAVVDAWGVVTIPSVSIAPGQPTIVTLTTDG